jgi:hypothetical protein
MRMADSSSTNVANFSLARTEPLSVAAMCIGNPDRSPVGIQRLTGIAQVHGCFSSQSFWKRGSLRSGSNIGSSLNSAGVSGICEGNGPSYGIESNFFKAAMEQEEKKNRGRCRFGVSWRAGGWNRIPGGQRTSRRVVFSLDLDLAKFDPSCFHISMFCWLQLQGKRQGF